MIDFDSTSLSQLRAIGTGSFDFDKAVSGKSLVSGVSGEKSRQEKPQERRDWPYSLTEYLRGHIGRMARVEYANPNGQRMAAMGRLKIVGTDFVGLVLPQSGEQVLIGFGSIASIKVPGAK